MKRTYFSVLIAALLTIAIGAYQYLRLGSVAPIQLQFLIVKADGAPASKSTVTLRVDSSTLKQAADGDGRVQLFVPAASLTQLADLTIEEPSSATFKAKYVVPTQNATSRFVLAMATPASSVPLVAPPREHVEKVYRSGPLLSGAKANFSEPPYELCGETPQGYVVESVSMQLSGDRVCGAWSECIEYRSGANACMRFRLQGHNEWPGSGQGLSEGILKVRYKRAG